MHVKRGGLSPSFADTKNGRSIMSSNRLSHTQEFDFEQDGIEDYEHHYEGGDEVQSDRNGPSKV